MVMPYMTERPLSDKAKIILLAAVKGTGNNEGLIRFSLPKKSGQYGMVEDPMGIETCMAGDENVINGKSGHRVSLEYREAVSELLNAGLAEQITDNAYRLTMSGYQRADQITGDKDS